MKLSITLVAAFAVATASPITRPHQQFSKPLQATVSLDQISAALQDENTNPAVIPYLENAQYDLMVAMNNGQEENTINLTIPAMEVHTWTLHQLSAALENPNTDPELRVYLEYALNQLMAALFSGNQIESIAVATPPGVVTSAPAANPVPVVLPAAPHPVVVPAPVVLPPAPKPEVVAGPAVLPPAPKPLPVVAATPELAAPEAQTAPLVQIIVNVKQQQVDAPVPVLAPEPENANEQTIEPVNVVEQAPAPVVVVDKPAPINPIDVIAVAAPEPAVNPIDVIAVAAPEPAVNPIDVIAVAAPEPAVNPIDVIAVAAPEPAVNPIDVIAVAAPEPAVNPIDVIAVAAPEPAVNPIDVIAVAAPEPAVKRN